MRPTLVSLLMLLGVLGALAPDARAQSLGTFSWQLQPFCNVVTANITQQGQVYTVDGYDDQCGAAQRAPLVGLATLNPDGSIGLGLHVVTVPGGRGVQIDARISVASGSGPWSDSSGNTGTFALGARTGGNARPAPTIPGGFIAPGSITGAQLAAGTITATQLAPGSVTAAQLAPGVAQVPVTGVCSNGQALRGVNPNGTVVCTNVFTTVDDPANLVGEDTSVALGVDGLPVIAHYDSTAQALRVTHCGNAACTASNLTTTVDDAAGAERVGQLPSIAIGTDGLPIISHLNATPGQFLRMTHCGNVTCSSGNVTTVVDGNGSNFVGSYSSLAIGADGLPVISHLRNDGSGGMLRVTHCGTVDCTAGNSSFTADDPPFPTGLGTSIAIGTDALPIIAAWADGPVALRMTHCGNPACTAGNVSTTVVDPGRFVGRDPSVAIGADGLPVISHRDTTGGFNIATLRVTHCGNVACTAGNISSTADDPAQAVGSLSSLAIGTDGLPVISHQDDSGGLRVTHCGNATCAAGNVSATVDAPVNVVGAYSSLVIADGFPLISYQDSTAQALRVAKCGTRTCQ